jgi:hypothetical protein
MSMLWLIQLVIVLAVFGVLLWAINTYIPMDETIKKILNVVVILVVILFVLNAFGVLGSMSGTYGTMPIYGTMPWLIHLVIVLVVFGVLLWAINTYIPMDATIKKILNVVVILVVILFILSALGILGSM